MAAKTFAAILVYRQTSLYTTSNQYNNKEGVNDYNLRRWLMLNRYKYLTICLITCSSSSSSKTGLHDDGNPINVIILFLPQPRRVPIHPQDRLLRLRLLRLRRLLQRVSFFFSREPFLVMHQLQQQQTTTGMVAIADVGVLPSF